MELRGVGRREIRRKALDRLRIKDQYGKHLLRNSTK
jgi:hypothetical protein